MNKHFRHLSIVLAVIMILTCSFSFAFADGQKTDAELFGNIHSDDIVILFTNDVHCAIDNYTYLAAYRDDVAGIAKKVILADCGDAVQGKAVGTLTKGTAIVDIMNEMKYDVAIPGNHEFDYGMEQFFANAKAQKAKYICSNFMSKGQQAMDGYTIFTVGDKKIAFVAVDTPETITKSTPTFFQDAEGKYIYSFCGDKTGKELYAQVQKNIDAVMAEKPDYIIGLFHCGEDPASTPWMSAEIIANTTGFNAVLDGHSHTVDKGTVVKDKAGKEVLLAQTGTELKNVGQLAIHSDGKMSASLVSLGAEGEYTKTNASMSKFLKAINEKNDELLNKVIGKSDVNLTLKGLDGQRGVRKYESNLGDFSADAYKAVMGADIAFVNGGGIRADIKKGDITYGNVIAVHPFNNAACLIEATGQQILDALEFAYRGTPTEEIGGFLQVSGMTCNVNTTIASSVVMDENKAFVKVDGARRVSDVKVNGVALDPKKTYKLASHNYMLKNGGDGFTMFKGNKILLDSIMLDNEVLITYVKENLKGTIPATYAQPQARIVISAPFVDTYNHWAGEFVAYTYRAGIIKGTSATTFSPKATMTKEAFLTTLGRMGGVKEAAEGEYWADPFVKWAQENKICETEGFKGKDAITRMEMAEYIYKFYIHEGKGPVGSWAIKLDYKDISNVEDTSAIMFNTIKGFFGGYPDGTFGVANTANRAEVSKVLSLVHQDLNK